MSTDPLLALTVTTPVLQLCGATEELLDRLAAHVRNGQADAEPPPFDDPISLYEADPELRVQKWRQGINRGRVRFDSDSWRLYFAVVVDGEPVGMQDLLGARDGNDRTVTTFSWLAAAFRGRGIGREMRHAILHLAFDGLGASEATSSAFTDNSGSNAVSRALGYEPDGIEWQTRRGQRAPMQRWRLTRAVWQRERRDDIRLDDVQAASVRLGW
ncbi:GNAT family N-acetyltransferase [Ruania zhangjianzhongii]|uniref:GNAT family N-acetyltransferase n=1 Tax=Ruania zhangjianzhongii TaxID=2603206 RepID=UPI0011CA64C4|nr:GNAT family protein [Ruania zhangjianzhongii]